MRRSLLAVAVGLLVAVGAVVLSVRPVSGGISSSPPAPLSEVTVSGNIQAFPPDGGAEVFIPGRVDTNITNEYVPIGMGATGPKLEAEVTGPLGGPVTIAGTADVTNSVVGLLNGTIVNLTPQAMAALTGSRVCTDFPIGNNLIGSNVFTFLNYPGQQSAAITLHDMGVAVDYGACWRASQPDGGPPPSCDLDAGVANVPIHNGGTWIVDGLADHHRLRCIACTHAGPPGAGTMQAGGAITICTPTP